MTAIYIIAACIACFTGGYYFFKQPKFGVSPKALATQKSKNSPNYTNGAFQNLSPTPSLAEGHSFAGVLWKFFFGKGRRNKPLSALPSEKTNLKTLNPDENVVVWFGHSSYFIQADGKTFLADPVFSGNASPLSFTTKAYKGSDVYTTDDMPDIDYLYISHDHWDHMDYETLLKLKPKVKRVITGLGTGAHLRRWGYSPETINEYDWYEPVTMAQGFSGYITPGRHFSGRGFTRNSTLWTSFVLKTPSFSLFLGGDSGYDSHFKEIGKKYGPFDLALLECGQYNEAWRYIHMLPEQVVQAAEDLNTKKLMPVHWAKFSLALHNWDEPIIRVTAAAARQNMPILTPMIGQKVQLGTSQQFEAWWNRAD
ncbi:MBL fold metallo-hydrolase [Flavobacterium rhizosphaerae]|uniref:MBL fold metallo-hydrolase n=1 Tax=Flavobacterium rhizosphaerae TaxID=3163298 RepID=A0ABW8YVP0_9FLAO